MKCMRSGLTLMSPRPYTENNPIGSSRVLQLSRPWSNSSPRGVLEPVRRACLPSIPSIIIGISQWVCLNPASHCPIIKESEDTQSVVQSDEICSDCFGRIVSIPPPNCWAKFLNDSEKLPPIVGKSLTHHRQSPPIVIFPQRMFSHWPDFSSDFPPDRPIPRAMGRRLNNLCELLDYIAQSKGL